MTPNFGLGITIDLKQEKKHGTIVIIMFVNFLDSNSWCLPSSQEHNKLLLASYMAENLN